LRAIRRFIYKREIKKRISKILDLLEEGKTKTAVKSKAGMKTRAACLELLTLHGREDKLSTAF